MDSANEWFTLIVLPGLCLPMVVAGLFMFLQPQKYDFSVLFKKKKKNRRRKRKPSSQMAQ